MYRYKNPSATIEEEEEEYPEEEFIDAMVTTSIGSRKYSIQSAKATAGATSRTSVSTKHQKYPEQRAENIEAQTISKKGANFESENDRRLRQERCTLDWFYWTMAFMTLIFLSLVGYGFGSGLYLPNKANAKGGNVSAGNADDTNDGFGVQQGESSFAGSISQDGLDASTDRQDYKYNLLTLLGLPTVMERSSPQARAIEWMAFDDEPLFDSDSVDGGIGGKAQKRLEQRYALVVWYFSHGGPTMWTTLNRDASSGWIEHGAGVHECDWSGIDCEYSGEELSQGKVVGLRLSPIMGLVMTGSSVSSELGMLTDLKRIDFSDQRLQGKLPDEWAKLRNIEVAVLSQNQLQSTIPPWIAGWTNLQHLALDGNQFYGTIPSSIANLQNLEHLELQENPQLRGRFDVVFANNNKNNSNLDGGGPRESLQHVDLSNTDLEGELPGSTLPSLTFLRLWNTNGLGGTLPTEIGTWSNLEYFSIKENPKLVGSLPTEFGLLQKLKTLEVLESNFMSGTLPTELGNLSSNLKIINFRYNNQTGSLPTEWSNIGGLQLLDVSTNRLDGTVPSEYEQLTQLRYLDLRGTRLEGEVPQGVCSLESREEFLADCSSSSENSPGKILCPCCVWCNKGNSYGDGD